MFVVCVAVLAMAAASCASGRATATGSKGRRDSERVIVVGGALGGVRAGETRTAVERLLGSGQTDSVTRHHYPRRRDVTLYRVRYGASGLTIVYGQAGAGRERVAGVFSTSPRYHTTTGLRVGATLGIARHRPGIRCTAQEGYVACQGGRGFEQPVTSFTVRNGRVVQVFMAAAAD